MFCCGAAGGGLSPVSSLKLLSLRQGCAVAACSPPKQPLKALPAALDSIILAILLHKSLPAPSAAVMTTPDVLHLDTPAPCRKLDDTKFENPFDSAYVRVIDDSEDGGARRRSRSRSRGRSVSRGRLAMGPPTSVGLPHSWECPANLFTSCCHAAAGRLPCLKGCMLSHKLPRWDSSERLALDPAQGAGCLLQNAAQKSC